MSTPGLIDDRPLPGLDPDAVYAAAAVVRAYCGWHLAPSIEETVTVDGSGTWALLLRTLRLTAVGAVVEDGAALASTAFEWSEDGVLAKGRWTSKRRGVVATITHGYDSCPLDVRAVVASLAKAGIAPAPQPRSVTRGPFAVTFDAATAPAGALDDHSKAILDRYRVL